MQAYFHCEPESNPMHGRRSVQNCWKWKSTNHCMMIEKDNEERTPTPAERMEPVKRKGLFIKWHSDGKFVLFFCPFFLPLNNCSPNYISFLIHSDSAKRKKLGSAISSCIFSFTLYLDNSKHCVRYFLGIFKGGN